MKKGFCNARTSNLLNKQKFLQFNDSDSHKFAFSTRPTWGERKQNHSFVTTDQIEIEITFKLHIRSTYCLPIDLQVQQSKLVEIGRKINKKEAFCPMKACESSGKIFPDSRRR